MLDIIYEDKNMIVVNKPAGQFVQSGRSFELDLTSEVLNYRREKGEEAYAAVINRLDRPVSGLVLFAKNKKEASRLSSLMQEEGFCKQYYAVCCGKLPDKNGEFVDYLLKDGKNNVSKVVREGTAGAKYAKLLYETLKEIEKDDKVYTLVKVTLITGRHHQIRVQFAHRNHPLLGDTKYGDERFNNEIALCAAFLSVDGHEYSIEPSWQF